MSRREFNRVVSRTIFVLANAVAAAAAAAAAAATTKPLVD